MISCAWWATWEPEMAPMHLSQPGDYRGLQPEPGLGTATPVLSVHLPPSPALCARVLVSMGSFSPPACPLWIWVPRHKGVPRFVCLMSSVRTRAGVRICKPTGAPADSLRTYLCHGPWCWLVRSMFNLHNKPRRRLQLPFHVCR